ncbi:hypothetical protein [Blastococcus saxobsidens]|uniref:hypothetical protein n=1 Tax=Blastococcus saxobsidens TaxID=138336 RepID=UPI001EF9544E|nr:hypothetical protein [Blastococcus saxobsidens]
MRTRQLTTATTVAATVLLLGACSSSPLEGKNGTEVAEAAADALEKAGSVHVQGTIEQGGEEGELDLQLQGEDSAGTLTIDGVAIELVTAGGEQFLKAPDDFWASSGLPEEVASSLAGKWVALPDGGADFAEFSLASILEDLRNPSSDVKDEVGEDEVDGTDVVVVEQEDGSKLFVADEDPAYPLRLTSVGDQTGTLDLSEFGEEQDISAPEGAVDFGELLGG